MYRWSYEETEHFVGDSLVLRQFCRVYLARVPDDTTLIRWANLIGPTTLEQLNERVLQLARSLKVTRGRKLRVDSTVVQTQIRHPTDSGILGSGVRVLSRVLRRAKALLGETAGMAKAAFQSHNRSVRRLTQPMYRIARRKGADAVAEMKQTYTKLLVSTRKTQARARTVCTVLRGRSDGLAQRLVHQVEQFVPRIDQAIVQAVRRVIDGEMVPANGKIVSLFEPHAQIIVRHKIGKAVEFGCKLWVEEVENGIISGYRVLEEPGQDDASFADSLTSHQRRFGKAPYLITGDRGVSTAKNEHLAQETGVNRVVLPWDRKRSPERRKHERDHWFWRGFRFRAGIEGKVPPGEGGQRVDRSASCAVATGLNRCPDHGLEGMGRYVGWGILTHNLLKIAQAQVAR